MEKCEISVIVPAFNEDLTLRALCGRLLPILEKYPSWEVIFVDDGSKDETLPMLRKMHENDPRVKYLSFSRNFGHQNALRAGMQYAEGDCVISMDCDLQHPPEIIDEMISKWKDGFRIVYTLRKDTEKVSFFKRKTANIFYNLMSKISDIDVPRGAADFRLLDRSIVEIVNSFNENSLFLRGIISWLGFEQCAIEYIPEQRFAGETKYSLKKMVSLALTGITSFSIKPLRLATFLGFFIACLAFLYGFYALYIKFFTERVMSGWTSILVSILFLAGIQLLTFGIMGEYVGKLFIESKSRPNYIIKEKKL